MSGIHEDGIDVALGLRRAGRLRAAGGEAAPQRRAVRVFVLRIVETLVAVDHGGAPSARRYPVPDSRGEGGAGMGAEQPLDGGRSRVGPLPPGGLLDVIGVAAVIPDRSLEHTCRLLLEALRNLGDHDDVALLIAQAQPLGA